jgi:hypothetical protein
VAQIETLSDHEISNFIKNYRKKNQNQGGIFTLKELLIEEARRSKSAFGDRETVVAIINLCRNSEDNRVSYGDLYNHLSAGAKWKGNATQALMSKVLDKAIAYCFKNSLPILTVLVVRTNRQLSSEAIENIFVTAKEMGVDAGLNAQNFVHIQTLNSVEFLNRQIELPAQ